jgi:hypothetical protein
LWTRQSNRRGRIHGYALSSIARLFEVLAGGGCGVLSTAC